MLSTSCKIGSLAVTWFTQRAPIVYIKSKIRIFRERFDVIGIESNIVSTTKCACKVVASEYCSTPKFHFYRRANDGIFTHYSTLPIRCLASTIKLSTARAGTKICAVFSVGMYFKKFSTLFAGARYSTELMFGSFLLVGSLCNSLAGNGATMVPDVCSRWIYPYRYLAGRAWCKLSSFHEMSLV